MHGHLYTKIRKFKKTTTAAATGTSPNKRFNEQSNGFARVLSISVHFFCILFKIARRDDQILRCLENVNDISNLTLFSILNFKISLTDRNKLNDFRVLREL